MMVIATKANADPSMDVYLEYAVKEQLRRDIKAKLMPTVNALVDEVVENLAQSLELTITREKRYDEWKKEYLTIIVNDRRNKND